MDFLDNSNNMAIGQCLEFGVDAVLKSHSKQWRERFSHVLLQ